MSRSSTALLGLNVYDDGDNAGAGSKTDPAPNNTGLNGNWKKIDDVVGAVISSGGALLSNVVTTSSIATDAVTLAKIGNGQVGLNKISSTATDTTSIAVVSGVLTIPTNGVTNAKLATDAVTSAKIATDAITSAKIATDAIIDGKIGDNIPKLKTNFLFSKTSATVGYLSAGLVTTSASVGIPMTRAGSITAVSVMNGTGTATSTAALGTHTFNIGDKLQVHIGGDQPPYTITTKINDGNKLTVSANDIAPTTTMIVNVEVEYD